MRISEFSVQQVDLAFKTPMKTSYRTYDSRPLLFVRLQMDDGSIGWGECSALPDKAHFWEDVDAARFSLERRVQPALVGSALVAEEVQEFAQRFDLGPMTAAAVEMALLDVTLRAKGESLVDYLGLAPAPVTASVAIGIPADFDADKFLTQVEGAVKQNVVGLKIKIEPGWAIEPLQAVRDRWPELSLIADANESFERGDVEMLTELNDMRVMIEQPLDREDLAGHAELRKAGVQNICLDESAESLDDIQTALMAKAADVFCLKASRLGGILATSEVQAWCEGAGVRTRIGGMYSSAFAGAVDRVLALGQEQSDISPGGMRFADDFDVAPPEVVGADGTLNTWPGPGVGPDLQEFLDN